ncbi:MAG: hypothetical protein LZ173_09705 [Thaumarchaeota archaeon]|jgi:hypothetical protein|nr:hypothetical protein [Candidatus Geocrenenecus arthurdayi]
MQGRSILDMLKLLKDTYENNLLGSTNVEVGLYGDSVIIRLLTGMVTAADLLGIFKATDELDVKINSLNIISEEGGGGIIVNLHIKDEYEEDSPVKRFIEYIRERREEG